LRSPEKKKKEGGPLIFANKKKSTKKERKFYTDGGRRPSVSLEKEEGKERGHLQGWDRIEEGGAGGDSEYYA